MVRDEVFVWLSARWRSMGEFWSGIPEHAAYQQCADDLLKVLGKDSNAHVEAPRDCEQRLEAEFGVTHSKAPESNSSEIVDDEMKEDSYFQHLVYQVMNRHKLDPKAFEDLCELLRLASGSGYVRGRKAGALAAKVRYKSP